MILMALVVFVIIAMTSMINMSEGSSSGMMGMDVAEAACPWPTPPIACTDGIGVNKTDCCSEATPQPSNFCCPSSYPNCVNGTCCPQGYPLYCRGKNQCCPATSHCDVDGNCAAKVIPIPSCEGGLCHILPRTLRIFRGNVIFYIGGASCGNGTCCSTSAGPLCCPWAGGICCGDECCPSGTSCDIIQGLPACRVNKTAAQLPNLSFDLSLNQVLSMLLCMLSSWSDINCVKVDNKDAAADHLSLPCLPTSQLFADAMNSLVVVLIVIRIGSVIVLNQLQVHVISIRVVYKISTIAQSMIIQLHMVYDTAIDLRNMKVDLMTLENGQNHNTMYITDVHVI
jgi:hypothetical protein